MGTVKGSVMDTNGAVIVTPKPSIIFEGNSNMKRVAVNDRGDYDITLPVGVYKVTTEIPGFHSLRRAEFRVQPGSTVTINLVPSPLYLVRGTTLSTSSSVDIAAPAPKYDEIHVPKSSPYPGSLLIQFERKRTINKSVEYDGAILTYDALTIYAEKLTLNKIALKLKASGERVVVEAGGQSRQVKQASISFKRGEPFVDLTK